MSKNPVSSAMDASIRDRELGKLKDDIIRIFPGSNPRKVDHLVSVIDEGGLRTSKGNPEAYTHFLKSTIQVLERNREGYMAGFLQQKGVNEYIQSQMLQQFFHQTLMQMGNQQLNHPSQPFMGHQQQHLQRPNNTSQPFTGHQQKPNNLSQPLMGSQRPNNPSQPLVGHQRQPNNPSQPLMGSQQPNNPSQPLVGRQRQPNNPSQPLMGSQQPNNPSQPLVGHQRQPNNPSQPLMGSQQPNNPSQPLVGHQRQPNNPSQPLMGSQRPNNSTQPLVGHQRQPNNPSQPLMGHQRQPNNPSQPLMGHQQHTNNPSQHMIRRPNIPIQPLMGNQQGIQRPKIPRHLLMGSQQKNQQLNFPSQPYMGQQQHQNTSPMGYQQQHQKNASGNVAPQFHHPNQVPRPQQYKRPHPSQLQHPQNPQNTQNHQLQNHQLKQNQVDLQQPKRPRIAAQPKQKPQQKAANKNSRVPASRVPQTSNKKSQKSKQAAEGVLRSKLSPIKDDMKETKIEDCSNMDVDMKETHTEELEEAPTIFRFTAGSSSAKENAIQQGDSTKLNKKEVDKEYLDKALSSPEITAVCSPDKDAANQDSSSAERFNDAAPDVCTLPDLKLKAPIQHDVAASLDLTDPQLKEYAPMIDLESLKKEVASINQDLFTAALKEMISEWNKDESNVTGEPFIEQERRLQDNDRIIIQPEKENTQDKNRDEVLLKLNVQKEIVAIRNKIIDIEAKIIEDEEENHNAIKNINPESVTEDDKRNGIIVKLSYLAISLDKEYKKLYKSQPKMQIKPLHLLIPPNYPERSPIILENYQDSISELSGDFSSKAIAKFNESVRCVDEPITVTKMADIWNSATREVMVSYAEKRGGGTFKYTKWNLY